jgi:hypothetical protein
LVSLYREDEYVIAEGTSLRMRVHAGLTAYGNAAPLSVGADISDLIDAASTYVFRGGYEHYTDDPAIRQLWLDSGFDVETI